MSLIFRAGHSIYDKSDRHESIRTEVLLLLASAFSAYAGRLNRYWKVEMGKYAREGKTFAEISDRELIMQQYTI
jgi:hypothetical protein